MAVGDIFEVRFVAHGLDQVAINVRHFRTTAETGLGVSQLELAIATSTLYAPLYRGLMGVHAEFRGVGVRRIVPGPPLAEVTTSTASGPGLRTGDPLPSQVSAVISLRTALGGRSARGRAYIGFPTEPDNGTNGRTEAAYLTALNTLATQMRLPDTVVGGVGTLTWEPVVWSRRLLQANLIIRSFGSERWATQRRRGQWGAFNPPPF